MLIDFNKIKQQNRIDEIINPRDIFMSLPNKDDKYQYLRDVQSEVLDKWFNTRENKNNIIKMNTGSGKTVNNLLMLKSSMNETKGKAIYVVPDNFLVSQVLKEAKDLGIPATENEETIDFKLGKSILVINIHKFVNGKSIFMNRHGETCIECDTILLDDVHACINSIESQFTMKIENINGLFSKIFNILESKMKEIYNIKFLELSDNIDMNLLVPYYLWQDVYLDIYKILQENEEVDNEVKFKLPLLRNYMSLCDCVISPNTIEISLEFIPFEIISAFKKAKRRIFVSATIADESILLSHFNLKRDELPEIIVPNKANDIGERFIICPQSINSNLDSSEIRKKVMELSEKINVVVLVPSNSRATQWRAFTENIVTSKELKDEINTISSRKSGISVFINKYDGIDLPDNMCRLLVIDDMPKLNTLFQNVLLQYLGVKSVDKQIQMIEQGMGRGVRSNNDYCAIVLMGNRLTNILYSKNLKDKMNVATKKQLELSHIISEQLKDASIDDIFNSINYCLLRNQDWKKQSKENLLDCKYSSNLNIDDIIEMKQEAFNYAKMNDYKKAFGKLQELINNKGNIMNSEEIGFIEYRMAGYANKYDKDKANNMLDLAIKNNNNLSDLRNGIVIREVEKEKLKPQVNNIFNFLNKNKENILDKISEINFEVDANKFEEGIEYLGKIIGAESIRPEKVYSKGPDNLWNFNNIVSFVIECKNEVAEKNIINKKDANQLNSSYEWAKQSYPISENIPIMIHPSNILMNNAIFNEDVKMLTNKEFLYFKKAVYEFIKELECNENYKSKQMIQDALIKHNLQFYNIINYTIKYQERD